MRTALLSSLLAFASCGGADRLTLSVAPDHEAAFTSFVDHVPWDVRLKVETSPRGGDIAVVEDLDCAECYELELDGGTWVVHAGDLLGAQYGVAHLLEEMGFRWPHPRHPRAPAALSEPDRSIAGVRHAPEVEGLRGLHMHTLHPIEGYFDFWEPEAEHREGAFAVIDWVIKNRANHLQWVGLDNISSSSFAHEDWEEHTAAILDEAHTRGLTTGLGIQLFGTANLQEAFDLIDRPGTEAENEASIRERLGQVAENLDFDVYNLSFGEFSGEEPEVFLAAGKQAVDLMHEIEPGVQVTSVIHVGNYDDLRITWEGEEILYYFLSDYIDADIRPWIHTVMYYNLYEDAGGAYLHDEFDEHRAFLHDKLIAGEEVGYFPETAYWVAFDVNVPSYLPLYQRSRWHDLDQIAQVQGSATLRDHVIFSSGWEWGYWQQDVTTLRASYEREASWEDHTRWLWTPYDDADALSDAVIAVTELEHEALLVKRLAPWLAGRDAAMDAGDGQGIISQPDRLTPDEVLALDPTALDGFEQDVVVPLYALSQDLFAVHAGLTDLEDDRFVEELKDGIEVTALRARFAAEVLDALLAASRGESVDYATPEATLAEALVVIERRHADLNDLERVIQLDEDNDTLYDYGYLAYAHNGCFWERELAKVANAIDDAGESVPGCLQLAR
ncbi:MAG: hypothetical protein EP330_26885 [Deltaproteobacteria bacterium]|nr:MAG: hypothetical protein EP330_26885 [Deltaproteobacteria bacterium]